MEVIKFRSFSYQVKKEILLKMLFCKNDGNQWIKFPCLFSGMFLNFSRKTFLIKNPSASSKYENQNCCNIYFFNNCSIPKKLSTVTSISIISHLQFENWKYHSNF